MSRFRLQRNGPQIARRLFLTAYLSVVFCCVFSPNANAQTTPERQTFADYLSQVAALKHVVIVAENIPLRLTITDEEKQALAASVQNLPQDKNIARRAAFFDYASQFVKPNVFVLRKKYTDPVDLPYVSLDEAVRFLEVGRRYISRYKSSFKNGSYDDDPAFMETARSFTPEQLALMKQGKMPMASLQPAQRQQLSNVARYFYINSEALGGAFYSQTNMDLVRTDAEGRFQHFSSPAENSTPIFAPFGFVYQTTGFRYNSKAVLPLSFQKGRHRTAQGEAMVPPEKDADGNALPFRDASEPNETDVKAAEAQTRALASPTVTTFGRLAQRLTVQSAGKTVYVVEDELQTNPVSIFGAENENAEVLFAACASAYDLRIVEEKGTEDAGTKGKRVLRLTRPIVNPPGRLQDLPRTVSRLMPGPYARALHLPELNAAYAVADAVTARTKRTIADRELRRARGENVPDPVITDEERARRKAEREKNEAAWNAWINAPDGMERAALRRLRTTLEPKVKAAPDKKAPLSALDDVEKSALTVALMYTALDSWQGFCLAHPPVYIERFDELMVYGKPYTNDDKVPCLEMQLGFLKPNGDFDAQTGFGVYLEDPEPYERKAMAEEAAR